VLCLLNEEACTLAPAAMSGPPEAIAATEEPAHHSPAREVLAGDRALPCGANGCGACLIVAAPYRTAHLAAPLRVEDRVIGALCVGHSQDGSFSNEDVDLLTRLATLAAVALENARLYAQAERVAALEERQRIAADMHDSVAQTLSFLGIKIDQAEELIRAGGMAGAVVTLARLRDAIDQVSEEVRRIIAHMQLPPHPRQSLQERLAELTDGSSASGNSTVHFVDSLLEPLWLSEDDIGQVMHIVQEAVLNARKHAQAHRITVRLERMETEVLLTIADDGHGFDPAVLPTDGTTHFGLRIMRARAARLGGKLNVASRPGEGTQVELRWSAERKATPRHEPLSFPEPTAAMHPPL